MSPLKWAILLVLILAVVLLLPPFFAGNFSQVGVAVAKWFIFSIVILLGGTWAEHTASKR